LRIIRFASRFGFAIVDELKEALCDPRIKKALQQKVSKERIGKELNGFFAGSPVRGFDLIHSFDLQNIIFEVPPSVDPITKEKSAEMNGMMDKIDRFRLLSKTEKEFFGPELRYLLFAGYFSPIIKNRFMNKKGKEDLVVHFIIAESIKLSTKDYETVELLGNSAHRFLDLLDAAKMGNEDSLSRKSLGLIIKRTGPMWKSALLIALCLRYSPEKASTEFDLLIDKVRDFKLEDVWNLKHLLDGNEVSKLLSTTPGSWMTNALNKETEWQLENPNLGVEECRKWMLSLKDELLRR